MNTREDLIDKARNLIAARLGWGDSKDWLNQDFIALSEKIFEKTGVSLSHQTLKRIWGKIKYDSLPNTHTLNTLAQYLGYVNWLEFKFEHEQKDEPAGFKEEPQVSKEPLKKKFDLKYYAIWAGGLFLMLIVMVNILSGRSAPINPSDYSFSSKKVVSQGVPNSVIFDFDAHRSPQDSIIIQQSWDARLQAKVHKDQKQHTSIYYYPGYFNARLIINNQIVKRHGLLIRSEGWLPLIKQKAVPVYLDRKAARVNGKLSISEEMVVGEQISMKPVPPETYLTNVKDYGEIYTDDFIFETSFKNDFKGGTSACQFSTILLQCEGNVIWVDFSAKGCVSELDISFTNHYQGGKQTDLSGFGVDFSDFVKFRIESKNGQARLLVNDKLAYWVTNNIEKAKIIGISFVFRGTGSVDYVKLANGREHYEDSFDEVQAN